MRKTYQFFNGRAVPKTSCLSSKSEQAIYIVVNSVFPENCKKAIKYWTRILIDVGWFWFWAALHNYRNKVSFVGVTNLMQSHNKQVFLALGIYTLLSHCFVFKIFLAILRSRKSLISSDCHIWLCKRKNLPLPDFIRQTYIYHCMELESVSQCLWLLSWYKKAMF